MVKSNKQVSSGGFRTLNGAQHVLAIRVNLNHPQERPRASTELQRTPRQTPRSPNRRVVTEQSPSTDLIVTGKVGREAIS